MPAAVDDVNAGLLLTALGQNTTGMAQGHAFLMETSRLSYNRGIDTREAMALQEARTSAQSREVLQTQAALNAPRQTAPGYVPEAPKA